MQLDLGTGQRSLSLDSRLEGFAEIAGVAAQQAGRRGCRLDETTLLNLKALGVRGDD